MKKFNCIYGIIYFDIFIYMYYCICNIIFKMIKYLLIKKENG